MPKRYWAVYKTDKLTVDEKDSVKSFASENKLIVVDARFLDHVKVDELARIGDKWVDGFEPEVKVAQEQTLETTVITETSEVETKPKRGRGPKQ